MILQIIAPVSASALTGGPQQPEFSSFEPVGSTGMVSEFTGAFTYNLPVLNVPGPNGVGYALSLSYHSNPSPEEEASWVGYGWTLNPGAITRSKRGFPDDRKNASVSYWNKTRDNVTITATKRLGLEFWSGEDTNKQVSGGVSGFITNRFNNYRGYSYTSGFNLQFMGVANVGYAQTDGEGAWSFAISPVALLSKLSSLGGDGPAASKWSQVPEKLLRGAVEGTVARAHTISSATGAYGVWNFSDFSMPANAPTYEGSMYTFGAAVEGTVMPNFGLEGGVSGTIARQWSEARIDRETVGYMYSGEADQSDESTQIMDYRMEKESSYNSRDQFLAIPFPLADQFIVSGEGVGGGFRLHHNRPGHFRPNYGQSSTSFLSGNLDIQIGGSVGSGGGVAGGSQEFTVSRDASGPFSFGAADANDRPFFRFTDDLGGNALQSTSDQAVRAIYTGDDYSFGSGVISSGAQSSRPGRAGFIGYNTNAELTVRPQDGCHETSDVQSTAFARTNKKSSDSDLNLGEFVNRSEPGIADGIGEFAITKEDGTTYLYGLPVYSRNEANLQIGLYGAEAPGDNFTAYHHVPMTETGDHTLVGQVDNQPYATTYLLTGIIGPDYVDVTNDGLTDDDVGGFVRFNYSRVAGTKSKTGSIDGWYKWRMPYRGLQYQRNSLSDPTDDVGAVQFGYKELYYLKSIETKSHVAQFITEERTDGLPAVEDEQTASADDAATTAGTPGVPKLRKLVRIDLLKKNRTQPQRVLLSSVHFHHSNRLCPGLPNSSGTGTESGKLTLEKVWFEYEGVVNASIAPYEFGYDYMTSSEYDALLGSSMAERAEYAHFLNLGDTLSATDQNPPYNETNIDRWGSYQADGPARHARFNPWVKQRRAERDEELPVFDPAAWHLKTIKLPSGGQIHVQYEQNEYTHVQHRPAMVMAPLRIRDDAGAYGTTERQVYGIDHIQAGIPSSSLKELERQLHDRYVSSRGPRELLYFRFLYVLEGASEVQAARDTLLSRCNTEFISGYGKVESITLNKGSDEGDEAHFDDWIEVRFQTENDGDLSVPERICYDYARTHGSGVRNLGGICDASQADDVESRLSEGAEASEIFRLFFGVLPTYDEDLSCKWLSYENSYLRIPTPLPKRGGGVRVKRLLMVDPGVETGEAGLYGTEYSYVNEDGSCSGVATNEPAVGREENALVTILQKRSPVEYEAYAGEDKEQFEGPIGETLLPGPSVGYGRVVARNIHRGATGTGAVVSQFYTARDFPSDLTYATEAGLSALGTKKTAIAGPDRVPIGFNAVLFSGEFSDLWKSQGYRFIVTNMHGQPKSTATFSEAPEGKTLGTEVASVTYEYFRPGEQIPLAVGPSFGDTVMAFPGKEVEVVTESRRISDVTLDANGQFDVGVGFLLFPVPFGSVSVASSLNQTIMRQHVTTKIIRYPVVQKRVTVKKDGIATTTENMAFDPLSGKPALVQTTDGFHLLPVMSTIHGGAYYTSTVPASREYPQLGQKASNYRLTFGGASTTHEIDKRYADGKHWLTFRGLAPRGLGQVFAGLAEGDVVEIAGNVGGAPGSLGIYHIGRRAGSRIELVPVSYSRSNTEFETGRVTVTVLRSGRTNQLTAEVGSFTTYGIPPVFEPVSHP